MRSMAAAATASRQVKAPSATRRRTARTSPVARMRGERFAVHSRQASPMVLTSLPRRAAIAPAPRVPSRPVPVTSAGVLLHRPGPDGIEVLLVHPGGPYWAKKDEGAWSIPKGELEPGEAPRARALVEFAEEL